jgi:rod shape-determining protein MreD
MRQHWIWLAAFFCFIVEGSLFPWFIPAAWQEQILLSPHFVLVIVCYAALFSNRYLALAIGLVFGLVHDVVYYGHMLGLYAFSMGLTGYLTGLVFYRPHIHYIYGILIVAACSIFFDSLVYALYRLFGVIDEPYQWVFMQQILPSLAVTLIFALIVYYPVRQLYLLRPKPSKEEIS